MNKRNLFLVLACFFAPVATAANAARIEAVKHPAQLDVNVEQAPLDEVLDKLAQAADISIHHRELPNISVSAHCSGTEIKTVLDCLFQSDTDLVYGYAPQSNKPTEIWLLGKAGLNCPQTDDKRTTGTCPQTASAQASQTHSARTDELLEMASSEDPARRSAAISMLAHEAQDNNKAIHNTLANALSDTHPQVRAQAISSLSNREGKAATPALQQALHDADASVRLMAVSHAGDNPELLMQAVDDTDKTVSSLASMKLEELNAR